MEPTTEQNNQPSNTFLSVSAFVFKCLCALTISQIGGFIFWLLSIISLCLIIIINWPKAKEVINTYRKK